jgi:hypothetical protein
METTSTWNAVFKIGDDRRPESPLHRERSYPAAWRGSVRYACHSESQKFSGGVTSVSPG